MKAIFEGLKVLCPIPGAPIREDYPSRKAHIEATNRVITDHFDALPPEPMQTYKCQRCKDQGGFTTKKEANGRLYEYWNECDCIGRGSWAKPNHGFPDYVQQVPFHKLKAGECERIAATIAGKRRAVAHIGTNPARAYQIGLAMASKIADAGLTVRVVSAKEAPVEFGSAWDLQVTSAHALFVCDVDRRLAPPQVQAVAALIDRCDVRGLVVLGEPLKNLPKNNVYAAVALSLQAKGAQTVNA